jgi:choline-sulfatase
MCAARPNILLIVVDQLTAFVLQAYGGRVARTPNINRLAAEGVLFEQAYCNYPLCLPARAALMTGRLPSRVGAYDNGAELSAATPTFAHALRAAGYYTCLSGKMHFVGPDQFHGFETRLTTEIYPADFGWTPTSSYADMDQDDERRYAAGTSTTDTVRDAGPLARTMQLDYDEEVCHRAVQELYMRARHGDGRPFALTVSFTHPHDPYVIPREYWERHAADEIDAPRVAFIPPEDRDPHSRSLFYHYGQDKAPVDDAAYRDARRGYYGMVAYVDDLVRRLLAALGDAGFAGNTVVLFTSDHGDMIGERGMWFKKTLFEPAIHVPLIVWAPGRVAPHRVAGAVSLLDILPTFVEVAGGSLDAYPAALDGASLVPALLGKSVPNGRVIAEHIDGGTLAPRIMLREGDWKLVHSRAYPPLLFNLSADPLECENLADLPVHRDRLAAMTAAIEGEYDLDALPETVMADQRVRRFVDSALSEGERRAWDFRAQPQIDRWFVRRGDAFPAVERRGYLPYRHD